MSVWLDDEPRIKNGIYPVIYHSHYFNNNFNKYTLVLRFQLAELNEEHKHSLFSMWLPIKYFEKNKKGRVKWVVSKNQNLAKMWIKLFPNQKVKRWDRLPLSQLKGLILMATIKDGKTDYNQKLKPEALRISKIYELNLPDCLP